MTGQPTRRPDPAAPTTAALVTAPARGGIAVIVLAGPRSRRIVEEVFRPRAAAPAIGRLALGRIVRGEEIVDEAVVTLLPGRAAEINIHGGPHVARRVLAVLAERGAEVAADPGADPALALPHPDFDNPAVAAEVVDALRLAATPLAAAAVAAQWSGGLTALAAAECPDGRALRAAAAALPRMRRLLEPAEVVLAGPPNVGKSALANALAGRRVSIVSETPGTTRDWVCCLADADGAAVHLTDTAGLWEAPGGVDAEAVRRAWGRIESADLVLAVTAGPPGEHAGLVRRLRAAGHVLAVAGKSDRFAPPADCDVAVSARTLDGLDALRRAVRARLGLADLDPADAMAFTARQAALLGAAADALPGAPGDARARLAELLVGPAG